MDTERQSKKIFLKILCILTIVSILLSVFIVSASADTFTNASEYTGLYNYCGLPLSLTILGVNEAVNTQSLLITDYGGIPYNYDTTSTVSINTRRINTYPLTNNLDESFIPDPNYKYFASRYTAFTPSPGVWYENPVDFRLYGSVSSDIESSVYDYGYSLGVFDGDYTENDLIILKNYYSALLNTVDVSIYKWSTNELALGYDYHLAYNGFIDINLLASRTTFNRLLPSKVYNSIAIADRRVFFDPSVKILGYLDIELYDYSTNISRTYSGTSLSPVSFGGDFVASEKYYIGSVSDYFVDVVFNSVTKEKYGYEIFSYYVDLYYFFQSAMDGLDLGPTEVITGISFSINEVFGTDSNSYYKAYNDFLTSDLSVNSIGAFDARNNIKSITLFYDDCYGDSVGLASNVFLPNDDSDYVKYPVYLTNFSLVDWLGDTLGGVFDVPLIGNITLTHILLVAVGTFFVLMVLKFFAGG